MNFYSLLLHHKYWPCKLIAGKKTNNVVAGSAYMYISCFSTTLNLSQTHTMMAMSEVKKQGVLIKGNLHALSNQF